MVFPCPKCCCSQWRATSSIARSKRFGFPLQCLPWDWLSGRLWAAFSFGFRYFGGENKGEKKQKNSTKNEPNSMGALVYTGLRGER